jgi:GH24 family phage-related lysozyme (muramidase)
MKLEDFLTKEEGDDSKRLPDGRYGATWDSLGKVWNIGCGLTVGVTKDTVWTADELRQHEEAELAGVVAGVDKLVKIRLGENKTTVLQSFAYNVGLGALASSSILKSVNAGRFDEVPAELRRYVHARGASGPVPGLVHRREDEIRLWNHPDSVPAAITTPRNVPQALLDQTPAKVDAPLPAPTPGGKIVMNNLLLKMGAQWALNRLGEGTTWAGIWATVHSSYGIILNPQIEGNLSNAAMLIVGAILIVVKEGWHKHEVLA